MSISREVRDELRSLAAEATPGPWVQGDPFNTQRPGWGIADDPEKCIFCLKGEPLVSTFSDDGGAWHVHRGEPWEPAHMITSASKYERVAGNYDYEEGGIIDAADCAYIVACDPQTITALLDSIDEVAAFLPAVLEHLGCVEGQRDQEFASTTWPSDHAADSDSSQCVSCFDTWPCPVERADRWVAEHAEAET